MEVTFARLLEFYHGLWRQKVRPLHKPFTERDESCNNILRWNGSKLKIQEAAPTAYAIFYCNSLYSDTVQISTTNKR